MVAINKREYSLARDLLRDVRMRSGILPAEFADLLIDALENPGLVEDTAQKVVSAVRNGEMKPWVGFESLLILGSPRVFDLGINPRADINRLQLLAQLWNNWAVDVRRDPRFKHWVEALGYVDFWRKYGWPDRCAPTGPDDFECI